MYMGIKAMFTPEYWWQCRFIFGRRLFCAGLHRGKFPECVHPPDAAWRKHRIATVALSPLQVFNSLVFEHPAGDVGLSARKVRELRRADFAAIFFGGTADRGGFSRVAGWFLGINPQGWRWFIAFCFRD